MSIFQKHKSHVRRNIMLLQLHNATQNMLFILPVLIPYCQDVIGIDFSDFLVLQVIFATTLILMEVPSGWISDVWKRKHTLSAGSLFCVTAWTVWLFADSFSMLVVAEMLLAFGISFISGTNTSLLYDSLLAVRVPRLYRRLEGRRHATGLYVIGACSVIGGFLYKIDPLIPMGLTVLCTFIGFLGTLLMHEPVRVKKTAISHPFKDIYETVRYAVHGHKDVAAVIIFAAILFGTTQAGFWTQQPYYIFLGIDEGLFGVLTAIGFLLAGLSGHFGHMSERYLPKGLAFSTLLVLVALAYGIAGAFPAYYAVGILYISSVAYGFGMPLVQQRINDMVGSERRATILSTTSLAVRFMFLPLALIIGWISEASDIRFVLIFLCGFLLLAGLPILLALQRSAKRRKNLPY